MLNIPDLMKNNPSLSAQASLVPSLVHSPDLALSGRPVKTVGVFYYRAYNGGGEQVLCHLIRLWAAESYQIVLITDCPPDSRDYPLPAGVRRYTLPDTFTLTENTRAERYRKLQEILSSEKIDAFVYHAWLSRNLLWDLLAVRTLGIPFVIYTHGVFSCLLSEGNLEDMDELPSLAEIYRLADRVICLSGTFAAFWNHFTPKTSVFLNPCLPAVKKLFPVRDPDLILWVGRISGEKQPIDAVRIFAEVKKHRPSARLAMVGGTDPVWADLEKQVRDLIVSLGLSDAVNLEGFREDVSPYYRKASVLLVTSAYEGFCLAIAEAKTYGLPCVMYNLPYLYFSEEPTGLFSVPQRDVPAAAEKLLSLMNDPDALSAAGKSALEGASAFSDATLTRQWSDLFSSLSASAPSVLPDDTESVMLETLLSHLHMGLDIANQKTAVLRDSAARGLIDSIFDVGYYGQRYPDIRTLYAGNDVQMLKHFLEVGMPEGRQGCAAFNVTAYRARWEDLRQVFGDDLVAYYLHYVLHGRQEGRAAN